jgi:lipopolysaccharide export system permease protein
MSAITRYILLELLKVFCATTTTISLFVLFYFAGDRVREVGLPFEGVTYVMPFFIPYSIKSALQAGLLFATCVVYGRIAVSNELVAVKSMGISPLIAVAPAILLATVLAVLAPLLDDFHSSWCCRQIQKVVVEHANEVFLKVLHEDGVLNLTGMTVSAERIDNCRLYGVKLNLAADEQNSAREITAHEACFTRNGNQPGWGLKLDRGQVTSDQYRLSFSDQVTFQLPIEPSDARAFSWSEVVAQRAALAGAKQKWLAAADAEESERLRMEYEAEAKTLRRYETQFMHKWANGFCCIGFVMLAAPVAMLLRTAGYMGSFFVCFLPVLLVYQPLHKLPTIYAEAGSIPPYFVWAADIVLIVVGAILLRVVCRK